MVEPHMASIGKLLKWDDVDTGGVAIEQVNESRMCCPFALWWRQGSHSWKDKMKTKKKNKQVPKNAWDNAKIDVTLLFLMWIMSRQAVVSWFCRAGKLVQCWFRQGIVPRAKTPGYESFPARKAGKEAHSTSKAWAVWCLMISGQIPIIR